MDPRTQNHLDRAKRHATLASALLDPAQAHLLTPPPYDWAVVTTFYAALHYLAAYLWEKHRVTTDTHGDMKDWVGRIYQLKPLRVAHARLLNLSWQARYLSVFTITAADAQALIDRDLASVRNEVCRLLGIQP